MTMADECFETLHRAGWYVGEVQVQTTGQHPAWSG